MLYRAATRTILVAAGSAALAGGRGMLTRLRPPRPRGERQSARPERPYRGPAVLSIAAGAIAPDWPRRDERLWSIEPTRPRTEGERIGRYRRVGHWWIFSCDQLERILAPAPYSAGA